MKVEIKVPQAGESVTEAMISQWFKEDGDWVDRDEDLLELETDKANMQLPAEESGKLSIAVQADEVVTVGQVIGHIDTDAKSSGKASSEKPEKPKSEDKKEEPPSDPPADNATDEPVLAPAARRVVEEHGLDPASIKGSGKDGRILKEDAMKALAQKQTQSQDQDKKPPTESKSETDEPRAEAATRAKVVDISRGSVADKGERVKPMSMMRRRIAQRLVEAQRDAAILTTFNEIDMSGFIAMREKYKEGFAKKHGVKLGFMSVFIKACVEGLKHVPEINAMIDGSNVIYRDYYDIGVAVGTDKGLVVPVVRDCDSLTFAQIEKEIGAYAAKARDGKITLDDLSGGTFTISNGGTYGSLLSTPILNPPQSGILGMHKTENRPIAVDDQVVIRPMMYVALSYDHRIVDGKGAVTFLVKVKECIEDPARILLEI